MTKSISMVGMPTVETSPDGSLVIVFRPTPMHFDHRYDPDTGVYTFKAWIGDHNEKT